MWWGRVNEKIWGKGSIQRGWQRCDVTNYIYSRTVTKYSFELLVPHLSISISSYCYWKKQKNQTKKNKYILRTHNTSLNEKHAPAPPPPQADSSASGEVWKHLAAGSRWFPSLHLLIKSINHVRQPCRAPCLTRGQQTARNEPTEESHWNHQTQWDSSWSARGWHLRMCWPSTWGRTMDTNFTLSNSLVYPWNNLLSSSLNFLLDCNWSRTLLFSILVCDVALRKLTMSSPEKCKSSHHLPPQCFFVQAHFSETLHIVSLTTFPFPCVKLNECVFVVRREK